MVLVKDRWTVCRSGVVRVKGTWQRGCQPAAKGSCVGGLVRDYAHAQASRQE